VGGGVVGEGGGGSDSGCRAESRASHRGDRMDDMRGEAGHDIAPACRPWPPSRSWVSCGAVSHGGYAGRGIGVKTEPGMGIGMRTVEAGMGMAEPGMGQPTP
jgi:hypothetical protein